jgi:predicted nicotinamide N-methyase
MNHDPAGFIRAHTHCTRPPLVPEVKLHLAGEVTPLWEATEGELGRSNTSPPYWGYAWPGGQAVTRYLLDRPDLVAGKTLLDFAAGSGLTAIGAALCGARARAVEIDAFAAAAIGLNAALNGVAVEVLCEDIVGQPQPGTDVVIAGDVCYERPMAERVLAWFKELANAGALVLIGDPGRAYLPREGLEKLATYNVPTTLDLEDRTERVTSVWRMPRA